MEAVYIDFAEAFDEISHSVLLNKLRKSGISGRLLAVIKSYLADRRQFVKVDKYYSSLLLVLSGVPQGSILGPLLFLLNVIDIPDGLVNAVYSFADDSKLLSWHSVNSLCHLQADFYRILQWCNDNCMMLHPDKCHLLLFSQRYCTVYVAEKELTVVDSQKDLGILFLSSLSWSHHIEKAYKKALVVLFLINRNCSGILPRVQKLNLYKTMVLPKLLYGSSVWYANIRNLKALESIQRKATK